MQILVISSKFPFPLKDGGAIATFNLISGLADLGNQVHLLSFNTHKHYIRKSEIPVDLFNRINYRMTDIDTTPGISGALKNLIFSDKPYILKRFKNSKFKLELIHILNEFSFDIVQIEGLYMLQYINIIRTNSNARVAYRPHNIEHQIWNELGKGNLLLFKNLYYKILSSRILKFEMDLINKYDLLLPISNEDSDFYREAGNLKPELIVPTGFNIQDIEIGYTITGKDSLYFLGSMEWRPNQQGIIWFLKNCWNVLSCKFPNLRFYIAGRNTSEKLMKEYNLPRVIWMGEIENKTEFIGNKSIMLVPLLSGSGMRIKIVEAFLNGKPVVSTTLGARGTMAVDKEQILLADSPELFVDMISKLLEDKELYRRLATNGYELARKHFDVENIARNLNDFYKQYSS